MIVSLLIGVKGFELIYRGSRDGYKADVFYEQCSNKGITVIIILSHDKNKIFGGYTENSWARDNDGNNNGSSFLFSL